MSPTSQPHFFPSLHPSSHLPIISLSLYEVLCSHSIPFLLLIPLPMKFSWTIYKGDNHFPFYSRSTQELSISQSTNRSLGVIMILTIQPVHSLHVKDTISSHSFQPVLPTAAREIFSAGKSDHDLIGSLSLSGMLSFSLSTALSSFSLCLNPFNGFLLFLREYQLPQHGIQWPCMFWHQSTSHTIPLIYSPWLQPCWPSFRSCR